MNPWWLVPAVGASLVALLEMLFQKVEISGSERAKKILLRLLEVTTVVILIVIIILVNTLQKAPG